MQELIQWHSPFRALVWKEWRESYWLLIVTAPASYTWHLFMPPHPRNWVFVTPVFMFVTLCLGARLFAGEATRGTAPFRNERPVPRGTVWAAAVALPLAAIVVAVAAKWIGGTWGVFGFEPPSQALFLAQLFAEGLLAFAIGTALSVMMDKPITAVAAGAVLCVAGVMALAGLTYRYGKEGFTLGTHWALTGAVFAAAIAFLLLSRRFFIRWQRD